jgi:hypothetical protein
MRLSIEYVKPDKHNGAIGAVMLRDIDAFLTSPKSKVSRGILVRHRVLDIVLTLAVEK